MKLLEIVNMMNIKENLKVWSISFLIKKKTESGISVNEQLNEELHKPIINIFKRKVYTKFKDNIWLAALAEMESWSSKNKNIKYLLCDIDVFTKYAWVKP